MTMRCETRDRMFVRCHGPLERGFVHRGHRHYIDHDSFVHEGTTLVVRYRLKREGPILDERTYVGPVRFKVAAGVFHEIEVVSEEGSWDCEFQIPEAGSAVTDVFHNELLD